MPIQYTKLSKKSIYINLFVYNLTVHCIKCKSSINRKPFYTGKGKFTHLTDIERRLVAI